MSDMIVVKAKIKEIAMRHKPGINVSGDFADELDKKVKQIIADAVKRAEANDRKTLMSKDL